VSVNRAGSFLTSIGEGGLDTPGGLTIDAAGNLWVVDTGHRDVKKYAPDGIQLTAIGAGYLKKPEAVAIDEHGTVFVSDAGLRAVAVFGANGAFLGSVTGTGADDAGGASSSVLPYPHGLKVASGRLYVVDRLSGVHVFRLDSLAVSEGER
jgi:streptogramin lyase